MKFVVLVAIKLLASKFGAGVVLPEAHGDMVIETTIHQDGSPNPFHRNLAGVMFEDSSCKAVIILLPKACDRKLILGCLTVKCIEPGRSCVWWAGPKCCEPKRCYPANFLVTGWCW